MTVGSFHFLAETDPHTANPITWNIRVGWSHHFSGLAAKRRDIIIRASGNCISIVCANVILAKGLISPQIGW